MNLLDLVPPHSVEAEQGVIGGLMLDNSASDLVADLLSAEDFFRRDHRLIFQAIEKLAACGSPIDVVTVFECLDEPDEAGGVGYLAELAKNTPSVANISTYASIVRERSHLRRLVMLGYALTTQVTQAFSRYGWCVAIRGVEGGGLVEGLPSHTFMTDDGEVALKCPTEIAITDRREKELSDLGFVPLVHRKDTDHAAFFATQSMQKQKQYNTDVANANARLSAQLQYIFATSRIAHYMKAIMRDKVGSFASRQDVESFLNNWLSSYVLLDDTASQEAKAKNPLREARVEVFEVPGKPGVYKSVSYLRPHYQLDELTASLRLVAELPKSTRS